jgi:hypothetical protein
VRLFQLAPVLLARQVAVLVEPQPALPLARVAQADLAVVFVPPRNRVGVQRRGGPGEGPADGHWLAQCELRATARHLREPRDAPRGCQVVLAALFRAALLQLRHRAAGNEPLHRAVRDAIGAAIGAHELADEHRAVAEAHTDALGAVDDVRLVAHLLDAGLSAPHPQPPVGVVLLAGLVRLPAVLQHGRHDRAAALGDPQLRADLGVHSADAAPEVGAVLVHRRRRPKHHRVEVVDGVATRRGQPRALEVRGALLSRGWYALRRDEHRQRQVDVPVIDGD